jgi:hypothetical protein
MEDDRKDNFDSLKLTREQRCGNHLPQSTNDPLLMALSWYAARVRQLFLLGFSKGRRLI